MMLDFLFQVFQEFSAEDAIIWKDQRVSYHWLQERTLYWLKKVEEEKDVIYFCK